MDDPLDELTVVVKDTLEARGVLGAIKAQLRAAVFTAIDEQERADGVHAENAAVQRMKKTEEGEVALELFLDFLEFYNLHSTASVFTAECSIPAPSSPANSSAAKKALAERAGAGAAFSARGRGVRPVSWVVGKWGRGGVGGGRGASD